MNCSKYSKPGHNVRTCKGEVDGNSRFDAAIVAMSYMATPTSGSQIRRTMDKLLVSMVTC